MSDWITEWLFQGFECKDGASPLYSFTYPSPSDMGQQETSYIYFLIKLFHEDNGQIWHSFSQAARNHPAVCWLLWKRGQRCSWGHITSLQDASLGPQDLVTSASRNVSSTVVWILITTWTDLVPLWGSSETHWPFSSTCTTQDRQTVHSPHSWYNPTTLLEKIFCWL